MLPLKTASQFAPVKYGDVQKTTEDRATAKTTLQPTPVAETTKHKENLLLQKRNSARYYTKDNKSSTAEHIHKQNDDMNVT